MSHSENGVAVGFHIAVIAVLLIYIHTQKPVSKYAYVMLGLVATGQATTDDIIPILERRQRECVGSAAPSPQPSRKNGQVEYRGAVGSNRKPRPPHAPIFHPGQGIDPT